MQKNLVNDLQWPESSGLGNVVDFCLATLPMALPPKVFFLFSLNQGILSKNFFKAMPLAMLPNKSLQHCQEQMIRANVSLTLSDLQPSPIKIEIP